MIYPQSWHLYVKAVDSEEGFFASYGRKIRAGAYVFYIEELWPHFWSATESSTGALVWAGEYFIKDLVAKLRDEEFLERIKQELSSERGRELAMKMDAYLHDESRHYLNAQERLISAEEEE